MLLKKCIVAAAILMACPTFASAQDIFASFSPTELELSQPFLFRNISVYIFSDGQFGFDAIDLEFTMPSSDFLFTGGEAFNPEFNAIGERKFDSSEITVDAAGTSARLFSVNVTQNGVNTFLGPLFDPGFVADVGPNGAVMLARVDYEWVGNLVDYANLEDYGCKDFTISLGPQGAVELPDNILNPSLGSFKISDGKYGCFRKGDMNHSGAVNFLDIAPFIEILSLENYYKREADCNEDEVVDFLDIAPFIAILSEAS